MNNDRLRRSLSKPRPCFAKTTSIRGGADQAIAVARTCPDVHLTPVRGEGQLARVARSCKVAEQRMPRSFRANRLGFAHRSRHERSVCLDRSPIARSARRRALAGLLDASCTWLTCNRKCLRAGGRYGRRPHGRQGGRPCVHPRTSPRHLRTRSDDAGGASCIRPSRRGALGTRDGALSSRSASGLRVRIDLAGGAGKLPRKDR